MSIPGGDQSTDAAFELRLKQRNEKGASDDETSTERGSKPKPSSTILTISVDTSTTTASPTTDATQSALPSPFDSNVPSDFKVPSSDSRCPNFISTLLSDPTFKSCYPISMLIQTSMGFFEAEKKLLSIVRVLDATCKANVSTCTEFLSQAAQNLTTESNCKAELDQRQPQVLQAWRGLKAYQVLYKATCLQDTSTSMYCFANAVTNLTTPSDASLYFMPFGLALPSSSTPSCNYCTQETMGIYRTASADRQQFVADKYEDAAKVIDKTCGPNFVNGTLPKAQSAAGVISPPSNILTLADTSGADTLRVDARMLFVRSNINYRATTTSILQASELDLF
ncbi:C6 transcription factor [Purpureocillium lavendulum]|uniref:C6 transcription factor n=1 Tax=Purpureocillium lavendulum TaxID=1247861 RepID=A0AB34G4Q8_9HYPO|nr:C6 transcription factor [Purpureocillium lavendulum]